VQEGEQAMTALMPHPPGGENDPDDRNLHVPAGEYHNDPDEPGGQVVGDDGGAEHGAHEQAMWAHDPTNQQLQQLQEVKCFVCNSLHLWAVLGLQQFSNSCLLRVWSGQRPDMAMPDQATGLALCL
jgi:hypothetical protein